MKGISNQFKQALFYDERNYLAFADISLADGTALTLTNSEIWAGGFSYEESVSEDNQFTAIGSVIIGSATIIINNIDEFYSVYDFTNAEVVLHIGMQFPDRLEKHQIGVYTVDETSYNGGTITLRLLDNLKQFDRPYSQSELAYPATLQSILVDCCTKCGVQLSPHSATFPHSSFVIQDAPEDKDATTFRDVVSWIATLAGCFVKCTADGKIELKWFDTETLESIDEIIDGGKFRPWESDDVDGGLMYPWENLSTIDGGTINPWTVGRAVDGGSFNPWFKDGIVDGGVFNPWSEGDSLDAGAFTDVKNIQYIYNLSSQNIDMDDVVITGVSVTLEDNDSDQRDSIYINTGTDDYEIQLNANPFITKDNAQTIIDWLGVQLIGLRFRRLNVTHLDDPSIEAGDVGIVIDRKQNVYKVLITRATFSIGSLQTIVCGAATPSRNSATQFSAQTKNYVRSRKLLKEEKSIREQLIDDLNDKINANGGLFTTPQTVAGGGTVYYLHNQPTLADSTIVWKMTSDAWSVTDNYQGEQTDWSAGLTVDGALIAKILSVIHINFDWGTGGTLKLGGENNVNGILQLYDEYSRLISSISNKGLFMDYGWFITRNPGPSGVPSYIKIHGGIVRFGTKASFASDDSTDQQVAEIFSYSNAIHFSMTGGMTFELSSGGGGGDKGILRLCSTQTYPWYFNGPAYFNHDIWATVHALSDERLKNIQDWNPNIDKFILNLNPILFTWKDKEKDTNYHVGLSAQKTKQLLSQYNLQSFGIVDHKGEFYSINYSELAPMLLPTIQRLSKENEDLKQELQEVKSRLKILEDKLQQIIDI